MLGAALALLFAPYLFGDRSLLSSAMDAASLYPAGATPDDHVPHTHTLDAGAPAWQSEPWLAVEHHILVDEHRLPFWDPYDGYGAPFDAAMQPQPFYPLTTLLALHPTVRLYNWFIVLRLFIAGWFAALFLRLFADRYAALAAASGTALTGYYLLYYNIPHLSVDTALPMLLWATELVVRRPSARRCGLLAVAAGLTYLGGMPESGLLSLSVAVLYGVLRVAGADGTRLRRAAGLAVGHACGLLVGAVTTVPFAEYVGRSLNQHDAQVLGTAVAGSAADIAWPTGVMTELAPLAFGYPWVSILANGAPNELRGFFGCTALVLALIALIAAWRRRDARVPLVTFFAAVALFCITKRFGNPLVNWVGYLPLFHLVHFPKYVEFCCGDAMAILGGFGVAALREGRAGRRIIVVAFGLALALLTGLYLHSRDMLAPVPNAWHYDAALATALVAMLACGALAFAVVAKTRWSPAAAAGLGLLVFAELTAGYAAPQLWQAMPPMHDDPYAGTPYLTYLAAHVDRDRERVFGVSGMLFPEWAGAYGFADPRALNALYPREFMPFIDAFVIKRRPHGDDLFDRFTGTYPIRLASPGVRRWMTLSSVAWVVSPQPIESVEPPPGSVLDALWDQSSGRIPDALVSAVRATSARIDGVAEDVLFEHPPYDDMRYTGVVDARRPAFIADIALDPGSYAQAPVCGGAVTFTVEVSSGGRIVRTVSRTIDPKHDVRQRHWLPFTIDLSALRGRTVTLRLATSAGELCSAWAIWGEPRFVAAGDAHPLRRSRPLFEPVFRSHGAFVYRIPGALPRLALFHRTALAPDDAHARALATDPSFDPVHDAVVDAPVRAEPPRGAESVTVTASRSDALVATVAASSAALLVQNDTLYPGWRASVDGRVVPMVRVDGLFRGVPVPAGRHVVRFEYASRVVAAGMIGTLAGTAWLLALFAWPALRRQRNGGGSASAGVAA